MNHEAIHEQSEASENDLRSRLEEAFSNPDTPLEQLTDLVRQARNTGVSLLVDEGEVGAMEGEMADGYDQGLFQRWDARLQRAFFGEDLNLVEIDTWLKNAKGAGVPDDVLVPYVEEKNNRWVEVFEAAKAKYDLPPKYFKELISKARKASVPLEVLNEYDIIKVYKGHMEAAFEKGLQAEGLNPFLNHLVEAGLPREERSYYQERIYKCYESDLDQLIQGGMGMAVITEKANSARLHGMPRPRLTPYLTQAIDHLSVQGNSNESKAAAECIQMAFYGGVDPERLMPGVAIVRQMRQGNSLSSSEREMEASHYKSKSFEEKAGWVKSTLEGLRAMGVPEDKLNKIKEQFLAESIAYLEEVASEPYAPYKFSNTIGYAAEAGIPEAMLAPYREQLRIKSGEYLPICFSDPKASLPRGYGNEVEALMDYFKFCKKIGVEHETLKPFGIPLLTKSIEGWQAHRVEEAMKLSREVGVSEEKLAPYYPEVAEFYRKEVAKNRKRWEDDGTFPFHKRSYLDDMIRLYENVQEMIGSANAEPVRLELEAGFIQKLSVMTESEAKPADLASQIELARQVGVSHGRLQPFFMALPSDLKNPVPTKGDQDNVSSVQNSADPSEEREAVLAKLKGFQLQDFGIAAQSKFTPYQLANKIEEAQKAGIEDEALKPYLNKLKSLQEAMLNSCMSTYHYVCFTADWTDTQVDHEKLSKALSFAQKWKLFDASELERYERILEIATLTPYFYGLSAWCKDQK